MKVREVFFIVKIKNPCLVKLNKGYKRLLQVLPVLSQTSMFAPPPAAAFAKSAVHGSLPSKMLQVFAFFGSLTSVQNLP